MTESSVADKRGGCEEGRASRHALGEEPELGAVWETMGHGC